MQKLYINSLFLSIFVLMIAFRVVSGFQDTSTEELLNVCSQEDAILDTDYIETLLINDADPNARTEKLGRTPLHYAAKAGNYKAVEFLLKFGADVAARDSHKWNALHYVAVQSAKNFCKKKVESYKRTIELLLEYDFKRYEYYKKEHEGSLEALKKFIPLHYAKNTKGNTPLYMALDPDEESSQEKSVVKITVGTTEIVALLAHNKKFSKQDLEDTVITEEQWEMFRKKAIENKISEKDILNIVAIRCPKNIQNDLSICVQDMLTKVCEESQKDIILKKQLEEILQILERCEQLK